MKKLMMVAAVALTAMGAMGATGLEVKLPATASISGYAGYTIWLVGGGSAEMPPKMENMGVTSEILDMVGANFADMVTGYWYDTALPDPYGSDPYNMTWSSLVDEFKKGGMLAYYGEYLPDAFGRNAGKVGADGVISLGDVRSDSSSWGGSALLAAVLIDGDGQFGTPGNDIVYGAFEMTEANYNENQGIDGTWKFGPFTAAAGSSPAPAPVPEPTGGLLLLLGVAGLALKRKRA